jgi:predicted membrane metal-binding protein
MNTFISTKFHAGLDYVGGILITASPWIFGFYNVGGASLFIPLVFGGLQLFMVIFTDHEGGLVKVIPLQIHLMVDMLVGFILIVSPFVYNFYPFVFLPHVLLGLLAFGSGIFTQSSPFIKEIQVLDPRGL